MQCQGEQLQYTTCEWLDLAASRPGWILRERGHMLRPEDKTHSQRLFLKVWLRTTDNMLQKAEKRGDEISGHRECAGSEGWRELLMAFIRLFSENTATALKSTAIAAYCVQVILLNVMGRRIQSLRATGTHRYSSYYYIAVMSCWKKKEAGRMNNGPCNGIRSQRQWHLRVTYVFFQTQIGGNEGWGFS